MPKWLNDTRRYLAWRLHFITARHRLIRLSVSLSIGDLLGRVSEVNLCSVMDWRFLWDSAGVAVAVLIQIVILQLTAPVVGSPQRNVRVLRFTTVLLEPYMMAKYTRGPGNVTTGVTYVGYMADLVRKLSEVVGFRYEIYVAPDNQYGFLQPDGTWNGMVKELLVKKADVAAGAMLVTSQREGVIDFTQPFLNVHATLLVRKPPAGSQASIRHARDLINQSEISYGTLDKGIIPRTFKKTNDSNLRQLWKDMNRFDKSVFTATNEQGIARVRRENYAFVIQDTIGDYISMQKPCDLMTVDKFLFQQSYALALPKKSVWLQLLNRGLLILKHDGVFNSLYRKWWIDKSQCDTQNPSRSISLAATSSGSRGTLNTLVFMFVVLMSNYWIVSCVCQPL